MNSTAKVRNILKEQEEENQYKAVRRQVVSLVNDLGIKRGCTGRNVIIESITYGVMHEEISVSKKLSDIKLIYSPVGIKLFGKDLTVNGVLNHKRIYYRMEANIRRSVTATTDPRYILTEKQTKTWEMLFGENFVEQPPNAKAFIYACIDYIRSGEYMINNTGHIELSESDIEDLREFIRKEVKSCMRDVIQETLKDMNKGISIIQETLRDVNEFISNKE